MNDVCTLYEPIAQQFNSNHNIANNYARFSIWALNILQADVIQQINQLDIDTNLKKQVIEFERQKVKICLINLDNNYKVNVILLDNYIRVHHIWNNNIFDIDIFPVTHWDDYAFKLTDSMIEYTLANIFDLIMASMINNINDIKDTNIQSIIRLTFPYSRYNYKYYKYLINNFPDAEFISKIRARMFLFECQ